MKVVYTEMTGNLVSAAMQKIIFLAFFFTFLLNASLVYFCVAQETIESQTTSAESGQKSTEIPTAPPSLSNLLTQTVIFIYEDKTPQNADRIGQKAPDTAVVGKVLGTAFIVGLPQPGRADMFIPFVVTAKHVVADRTKVLGRYTHKSGTEPVVAQYDLESLRKNGDLWEYPNDEGVDLVVFRTSVYDNVKFLPISVDLLASKDTFIQEHIEVSDRVMIPCLMQNYPGVTQNYPIFRDGSIALITEEPVQLKWKIGSRSMETKQRIIFINSTVNEGFSGAPVFLWPGIKSISGQYKLGGTPWLIGIVHGFFPQHRNIIDAEGENVTLTKPAKELPGFPGQIKPPRNVPVLSQDNSATGIIFPSWLLLDILQSDSVKNRIQQLTDEENKSRQQDKGS